MHNKTLNRYYFIKKFDQSHIDKQDKKTIIIFRNYDQDINEKLILTIKNYCKKKGNKFLISNNIKLAIELNLDGVYIPSFNRLCNFKNQNIKTNFKILGSAHNLIELKTKENQSCNEVFIAPIFKNEKSSSFLNVLKFNLIAKHSSEKIN